MVTVGGDGEMEYMNCGHVRPLLGRTTGHVTTLRDSNMPVSLFLCAHFACSRAQLQPGDRIVLVSDGVTDAQSVAGDFYGETRLQELVASGTPLEQILGCEQQFCGIARSMMIVRSPAWGMLATVSFPTRSEVGIVYTSTRGFGCSTSRVSRFCGSCAATRPRERYLFPLRWAGAICGILSRQVISVSRLNRKGVLGHGRLFSQFVFIRLYATRVLLSLET
jgi:hypothetical protein